MAVFEYQNEVIFTVTVYDGEPPCRIDICFWYPNKKNVFVKILKAIYFQYDFLRERGRCRTKTYVGKRVHERNESEPDAYDLRRKEQYRRRNERRKGTKERRGQGRLPR